MASPHLPTELIDLILQDAIDTTVRRHFHSGTERRNLKETAELFKAILLPLAIVNKSSRKMALRALKEEAEKTLDLIGLFEAAAKCGWPPKESVMSLLWGHVGTYDGLVKAVITWRA